jgi:hypothetical protein
MSISFDPLIDAPFLWAYKQRASKVKKPPIHNQPIKSTTKESTQPQLPMELLAKIIKIAHYENDTSIAPLMRVNQACNEIAGPLLYDTIHLNKYTLSKLPACILSKPSTNPVLQESHDRKLAALARTKKLVIEEIPILFHERHDLDLVKFCKKVVLPKVTKVVWCQHKAGEWGKEELEERKEKVKSIPINPMDAIPRCRADIFQKVLPAEHKTMCIQVPKSGLFQTLGPAAITRKLAWGEKPYTLRTIDRMLEYMNAMSGRVDIRIHQSINGRYICLGSLPTIYHFGKNRTPYSARSQIISAYRRATSHHMEPLLYMCRWHIQFRIDAFEYLLRRNMSREDQATEAKKVLYSWLPLMRLRSGATQKQVCAVMLQDFFQAAATLRAEGTGDACPCCGETSVAF